MVGLSSLAGRSTQIAAALEEAARNDIFVSSRGTYVAAGAGLHPAVNASDGGGSIAAPNVVLASRSALEALDTTPAGTLTANLANFANNDDIVGHLSHATRHPGLLIGLLAVLLSFCFCCIFQLRRFDHRRGIKGQAGEEMSEWVSASL